MKQPRQIVIFLLAILLVLTSSATAVTAAPSGKHNAGWSSITIWAFIDSDRNGFITAGDSYLHEVGACLTNKKAHQTFCGGTDYGDVWWEPLTGGVFVTWLDATDSDIPAGHKLNSITCYNSGTQSAGKDCITSLGKWEAQFKQEPGALMNVYYGFVPEE